MTQQTYTYDQLSKAFRLYLTERFDGDTEEVNLTVETAERIIPNTLNDYFGTHLESIYDLQDSNEIEAFRMKIKTHPVLKGLDMSDLDSAS